MTQQVVISTPEGTNTSQTLQNILALGVTVDNLSSSWLFLPDTGRFIPPWTASWSSPLVGTKSGILQWSSPGGIVVPTAGTGKATATFTDYTIPFNPGVVVVQAQPMGTATPPVTNAVTNLKFGALATLSQAIGASSHLVPALAGKTITVYGYSMGIAAAGSTVGFYGGQLVDTTGAAFIDFIGIELHTAVGMSGQSRNLSIPAGIQLPLGAGLDTQNSPASVDKIHISGAVVYTQA